MRYLILLLPIGLFIISGCQVSGSTGLQPTAAVTAELDLTKIEPTQLVPENSPTPSNDSDQGKDMAQLESHPHVFKAKDDLANQTNIPFDQIEVVSVQAMTWPDSSMGCPQPDMVYTQVLQDGLLIQLRADGFNYNYHSGGNRDPFLCIQTNKSKEPPIQLDPSMGLTPFIPDLDK